MVGKASKKSGYPMVSAYRAVSKSKKVKEKLFKPYSTMRPPGNIPYIVDNLWEWARPEGYPNRRFAAFASPTPKLAIEAVGATSSVYKVQFEGDKYEHNICQLVHSANNKDSKFHPECKSLKKIIIKILGNDFFSDILVNKQGIASLWMPCLRKKDVEHTFQNSILLKKNRDDIYNSINYWNDVFLLNDLNELPDKTGELFFEFSSGYYLVPK